MVYLPFTKRLLIRLYDIEILQISKVSKLFKRNVEVKGSTTQQIN